MQRFRSHSDHSLDPKGRLNIPARFREVLKEQYGSEMLVVTHWKECLRVYPMAEWLSIEETLLAKGKSQPNSARFVRYIIAGVVECTPDKQGRVLLTPALRSSVGLQKEVVVAGMLNYFEIWDKGAWDTETELARESFDDFSVGLSDLGI